MKRMTGRFLRHSWKCCGKSRGSAKFCPDCGTPKPPENDAAEMLAFFQQQRDTSEKSAQSWKKRADEDFSKSSEMQRLAEECDRCSDEEFPDLCRANKRIGHGASREARAYLQKSWEQLTSSRYDRDTSCHEKNLVDPYRGSWVNYWRVLLDPAMTRGTSIRALSKSWPRHGIRWRCKSNEVSDGTSQVRHETK